jgi:hypothetical protein
MTDNNRSAAHMANQLADLQRKFAALEAEKKEQIRSRKRLAKMVAYSMLSVALVATVAVAAPSGSLTCTDNADLFCFSPNTPARASEINHNFQKVEDWADANAAAAAQNKTWLEQKVGTVGSAAVRIQTGSIDSTATASGKPLFVSGDISADSNGIEFRHDNLTQGIGIGYNTIRAAGSNADQGINLKPKGTGVVLVTGDLEVTGSVTGSLLLGGTYTRWGGDGCAAGYNEVIDGHAGGMESYHQTGGYGYGNIECISDAATAGSNYGSSYYTRMLRGSSNAAGMASVTGSCSICSRGGCYTSLGSSTCATGSGYAAVYTGRVGGVELSGGSDHGAKTLCVDDTATSAYTWASGQSTRLMRFVDGSGADSGGMVAVTNSCAVCCK